MRTMERRGREEDRMATFRWILWGLVVVVAIGLGALYAMRGTGGPQPAASALGGPFTLENVAGGRFTDTDLKGKATALFFGFTNCPDVCPTTLTEATTWLEALGPDADKLRVVFVTVDPERDTADHLKAYLSSFDPRMIGLTGTPAEIDVVKKAYRVFARKVPTGTDYTMDHTATVYLLDAQGQFAGTIGYQEAKETALEKLRRLISRG
jgi:protein SCO1/2